MADNVAVTEGSGKTIATDDVGGAQYQQVKVNIGADGVATALTAGAGAVAAGTLRVTLASDDPAVAALTSSNAQLPTALGATTAAASLAVTLDTTMAVVEDAAAAANPTGLMNMAVRRDTLSATEVSAENDVVAVKATSKGQLHVYQEDGVALAPAGVTSATTIFTQDMSGYGSISVQVTVAGSGTITYETSDDNSTYTATPGTRVDSLGLNSNQATTTSTTAVQTLFPKTGKYFRARVSAYTSGTITVVATLHIAPFRNTVAAYIAQTLAVGGNVAHDSAVSGSPVRVAGRARTFGTPYTAVSADDVADLVTDLSGYLKTTVEYSFSHISTSTTTTVKSGAGVLHAISVNTKGTVASIITVYDNTAGSGTVIGVVDSLNLSGAFIFDVIFATGLTLVTTGTVAPDITVSYR